MQDRATQIKAIFDLKSDMNEASKATREISRLKSEIKTKKERIENNKVTDEMRAAKNKEIEETAKKAGEKAVFDKRTKHLVGRVIVIWLLYTLAFGAVYFAIGAQRVENNLGFIGLGITTVIVAVASLIAAFNVGPLLVGDKK